MRRRYRPRMHPSGPLVFVALFVLAVVLGSLALMAAAALWAFLGCITLVYG